MDKTNPILTAVMSKLISERDNVLAQLDIVINKKTSDNGISGLVEQATNLFKELSKVEYTIDTLNYTVKNNTESVKNSITDYSKDIQRLRETLVKMQEEKNFKMQHPNDNNS